MLQSSWIVFLKTTVLVDEWVGWGKGGFLQMIWINL